MFPAGSSRIFSDFPLQLLCKISVAFNGNRGMLLFPVI